MLISEHTKFERRFMLVQNNILKKNKKYPLDYIQRYPDMMIPRKYSKV